MRIDDDMPSFPSLPLPLPSLLFLVHYKGSGGTGRAMDLGFGGGLGTVTKATVAWVL